MPYVTSVRALGNSMTVYYDDGSQQVAYPTGRDIWLVKTGLPSDPAGGAPVPAGSIYNPWASYTISGSWADHMSYSAGGIDYPLPYGTAVKAPASGTLHTTGGSGETQVGWVGSAGRRSILLLDQAFPRIAGRPLEQNEGSGSMVAIVFQHQSQFGTDNHHYSKGETCGLSGASADGKDYGGDVHLHVHGLNASAQRVDLLNFIP